MTAVELCVEDVNVNVNEYELAEYLVLGVRIQ